MSIIKTSGLMLATLVSFGLNAKSDDLASVRQALQSKYTLTVTTADKTDIVTAGSVLVLKKSNLVTVDVKSRLFSQNHYRNGRIEQGLGSKVWHTRIGLPGASSAGGSDRHFVTGEKVWVTGIDISEKGILFSLFTDAYSDVRYEATLLFPFEKGSTPTTAGALATVAEVFEIQASDDSKGGAPAVQQAAGGGGGTPQPAAGGPAVAPAAAEAPPAPIAPPPPPPADPKTIALGQKPAQVTANFGQPDKIINLGNKQIYVYKDMKVTFIGGKVTDVQ